MKKQQLLLTNSVQHFSASLYTIASKYTDPTVFFLLKSNYKFNTVFFVMKIKTADYNIELIVKY